MNIKERINLIGLLPQEGNYETVIVSKDLKAKLDLSQEEIIASEFRTITEGENAFYKWEESKDSNKEIVLTVREKEIIKTQLEKIEKEGKINFSNVGLYETYVLNKEKAVTEEVKAEVTPEVVA